MNLTEFHFIRPYWLLALLPWLVLSIAAARRTLQRGNWNRVCDEALLPYILQNQLARPSRLPLAAAALASFLTIAALAGPTWERLPAPVFRNDAALVIALDLSRSMNAADIKPSRLIRARYKIEDILKRRKDGQTALLVYAGDAFTVTPLTDDTATISSLLQALDTGIMPSQGSNTKAALTLAKALLKQAGLQQGHILLVTDGIDFDEAESEIDYLGQYRLSILGVGTADGAPIPSGAGGFVKDRNGGIVVPKLDGAELHKAAMAGHGIYRTLSAHDDDVAGLSDFFDSKTQQEAVENSDLRMDRWDDKGPWLLLPVLPLAAFYFRKGLLAVALVMLVPLPKPVHAFEWRDLWQNRNHQAQQAFQAKQYEQAADKFDDPAWKAAAQYRAGLYDKAADTLKGRESADALYNRGNALAQAGQMEEALKAYDKVLAIDPNNEDARQNKDVVEKALEQQKQQQNGEGQSEQNPQDRQQNQDGQQSDSGQSDRKPQDAQDSSQDRQNGQTESSEQRPDQSDQASESSADKDDENERQSPQHAEAEQQNEEQARAQPQSGQQDEKPEGAAEQAVEPDQPVDENQAADEQWLKRIPDDPAGLLRRKFKYQYGQRARRNETEENW